METTLVPSYARVRFAQAPGLGRKEQQMGTTQEEPTLKELVSRLAELEQVYARLQEKLELSSETAPTAKPPRPGVFASDVAGTPPARGSRPNRADGGNAPSATGTRISATTGRGTGLVRPPSPDTRGPL